MEQVFENIGRFLSCGRKGTLVTITHTRGSTYRRAGAKMLCAQDSELIGSISGGCLEADVLERSLGVLEEGGPQLVKYETNAESDNVWDLGLGCNGSLEVLIESLKDWANPEGLQIFESACEHVRNRQSFALVSTLTRNDQPIRRVFRMLIDAGGGSSGSLGDTQLDLEARGQALLLLRGRPNRTSRKVMVRSGRDRWELFIDVLAPPTTLLVMGGGHDAIPLVRLASEMGFAVVLIDSRPQFATQERFPWASEVVCARPEEISTKVPFEGSPAVVVMNHHYGRDCATLGQVLSSPEHFLYVGALGPRARTEKMLDDLRAQGFLLKDDKLDALHAPIGLDLGSDNPDEIALGIVAEILAVKNDRPGGPLRNRKGPIHQVAAGP